MASLSPEHAEKASNVFHQPWFRWCVDINQRALFPLTAISPGSYTGDDPIGVELAGALKNVYAIASGIADGLGFENNTRASTYLVNCSRHSLMAITSQCLLPEAWLR